MSYKLAIKTVEISSSLFVFYFTLFLNCITNKYTL